MLALLAQDGIGLTTTGIVGTVIATVAAILGSGFGGAALKHLYDRSKLKGEQTLAENEQSSGQYNLLINRLESRITKVETDHQKCMDEHVQAARQLGILEGRVAELKESVKDNAVAIAKVGT